MGNMLYKTIMMAQQFQMSTMLQLFLIIKIVAKSLHLRKPPSSSKPQEKKFYANAFLAYYFISCGRKLIE